jgi:hypothetical protein
MVISIVLADVVIAHLAARVVIFFTTLTSTVILFTRALFDIHGIALKCTKFEVRKIAGKYSLRNSHRFYRICSLLVLDWCFITNSWYSGSPRQFS